MFRLGGVYTTTTTSTGTQGGGSVSLNTCQELFVALDLFMLSSFMSDFCKDQRRSDLHSAVLAPSSPPSREPPHPHSTCHGPASRLSRSRSQTSARASRRSLVTLVTVKEWLMEPRDTANSDEDTEHISGWSLQC